MNKKKSKHVPKLSIFASIRKPTAPPGIKFEKKEINEKHYPSRRKVKHKSKEEAES